MKIKYLNLTTVACLGLLAASCSNNDFADSSKGQGKIQLALTVDNTVTSRSFADDGIVTVDDLKIRLTNDEGNSLEYNSVSDFEATGGGVATGTYLIEAYFGDENEEGFAKPYVYGNTTVNVNLDDEVHATLTAALANSMFKVNYGDGIKAYLPEYCIEFSSTAGNNVEYPAGTTDPVYLKSGEVNIYLSFTKPNGATGRTSVAKVEAKPKTSYTLNVDMNGGEVGSAEIVNVTFNDNLEEVTIPVNLDLSSVSAPEVVAQGFADDPISFITTTEYANDLNFMVTARGGLQSVVLKSTNAKYLDSSWPEELELMGLSATDQEKYKELGLDAKGVWVNPDQMALINLAGLAKSVRLPEGTDNAELTFTLLVTDKNGKTNETSPTLKFSATRPTLSLASPYDVYYDDDELTLKVTYNAIAQNLEFTYHNNTNTETDLPVNGIVDNSDGTYDITITKYQEIPTPMVVTATDSKDKTVTASVSVDLLPVLLISDNNIWASKVDFKVYDGTQYWAPTNVYYSTDNSTFNSGTLETLSDNFYRISGLANSTTYYITADISKDSVTKRLKSIKVTTDGTAQITYANMDTWYDSLDAGLLDYYNIWWCGVNENTIWGTNNPMTTSQGAGYEYVRCAGTLPEDSGHTGKSALIRTIGWGSGNTATGSKGSSGTCKYTDAGLLHLGASRSERPSGYSSTQGALTTDDLECGYDFAYRPSSLSFWYLYTPKNSSDKGYVEYWVKDANGNIIASGSQNLDEKSSYTQVTLTFDYIVNAPKGAKIYIKFLSTYSRNFLERNDSNFSGPGFANVSHGKFLGSQLWIDDITLNY